MRYSTDGSHWQTTNASTTSVDGQYRSVATLTGLLPATCYYYRVLTGGTDITPWSTASFNTATSGTDFAFVAFGDSRDGSQSARDVAAQMAKWSYAFAVHVGDAVNLGSATEYDPMVFGVYRDLMGKVPFYMALGNHEYYGDGKAAFLRNFYPPQNGPTGLKGQAYSFDWGNAHLVVLDTDASSRGR